MGKTSIPCNEATRDRLDDLRDGQYKSWDAFLNQLADDWQGESDTTVDGLDSLARAMETVEERTGRIERTLEDLQRT